MQVINDYVYNPTPDDRRLSFCGVLFTFPKYKHTPVIMHEDFALHRKGIEQITKVLGPLGVFVLDHEEMAGGPNRKNMTEEECRAYADEYRKRLKTEGLNLYCDASKHQFIDLPEADNRKLAMANKAPVPQSRHTRIQLVKLRETEAYLRRVEDLTPEAEEAQIAKDIREMPEPDFSALPIAELRRYARTYGVSGSNAMSSEELLDALYGKTGKGKPAITGIDEITSGAGDNAA